MHQPERYENESFADYRKRRAESNRAAKRIAGHGLNGGINARQQFRDDMRKSGAMGKRTRAYVALMAAWASKRVPKWSGSRDANGAPFTLVGRNPDGTRRIWLAGISAQRGLLIPPSPSI